MEKINIKKFWLGEVLGYAVAHLVQALLQKPEGCCSIPEKQSEIVHWLNYTGALSTVLGSTQPLTKLSTRDISWKVKAVRARDDNLTIFMCLLSINSGSFNLLEHSGSVRPLIGPAAGWTMGDWIPVGATFFAPVETGPRAHPASKKTCTCSLSRA